MAIAATADAAIVQANDYKPADPPRPVDRAAGDGRGGPPPRQAPAGHGHRGSQRPRRVLDQPASGRPARGRARHVHGNQGGRPGGGGVVNGSSRWRARRRTSCRGSGGPDPGDLHVVARPADADPDAPGVLTRRLSSATSPATGCCPFDFDDGLYVTDRLGTLLRTLPLFFGTFSPDAAHVVGLHGNRHRALRDGDRCSGAVHGPSRPEPRSFARWSPGGVLVLDTIPHGAEPYGTDDTVVTFACTPAGRPLPPAARERDQRGRCRSCRSDAFGQFFDYAPVLTGPAYLRYQWGWCGA